MSEKKTYDLTGEEAYKLMVAALNVVSSPRKNVYQRIRRAHQTKVPTSNPSVYWEDFMGLANALNEISPGIVERTIDKTEESRRKNPPGQVGPSAR